MVRILIADQYAVVRRALRELVEDKFGWTVCGEASEAGEAFDLICAMQPDVVVLETALPNGGGVDLLRRLHEFCPQSRVLVFTSIGDEESVRAALTAGARGYLLKSEGLRQLEAALTAMQTNRPYFSPFIADLLMESAFNDQGRRRRARTFTSREREVAQLVASGNGNRDIARALNLSIKTVETHRSAAMRKAGVRSAAEFVRFAIRHHLITL